MVFSRNVPNSVQEEIRAIWGSNQLPQYEKYLGVPPFIGKSRKITFSEIKGKMWQHLNSWKGRLLSQGGQEILVKLVALAILTFAMSCFKFSKTLYCELEYIVANF